MKFTYEIQLSGIILILKIMVWLLLLLWAKRHIYFFQAKCEVNEINKWLFALRNLVHTLFSALNLSLPSVLSQNFCPFQSHSSNGSLNLTHSTQHFANKFHFPRSKNMCSAWSMQRNVWKKNTFTSKVRHKMKFMHSFNEKWGEKVEEVEGKKSMLIRST